MGMVLAVAVAVVGTALVVVGLARASRADPAHARGRARQLLAQQSEQLHLPLPDDPDLGVLVDRSSGRIARGGPLVVAILGLVLLVGGLYALAGWTIYTAWMGLAALIVGMQAVVGWSTRRERVRTAPRRLAMLSSRRLSDVMPVWGLVAEGLLLAALVAACALSTLDVYGTHAPASMVLLGIATGVSCVAVIVGQVQQATGPSGMSTRLGAAWDEVRRGQTATGSAFMLAVLTMNVVRALLPSSDQVSPHVHRLTLLLQLPVLVGFALLVPLMFAERRRAREAVRRFGVPA